MSTPRIAALLVAAALVACGGNSPEPAPTPTATAPTAPAPTAPVLAIAPLTLWFQGNPIARLHADGRSESVGDSAPGPDAQFSRGPTLHADGTLEFAGGVTGRVERDGRIVVVQPDSPPSEHLFGQIVGDELRVTGSSKPWDVRIQGDQLEFSNGVPSNQLTGATTPAHRRTALVLTAAYFIELALTPR